MRELPEKQLNVYAVFRVCVYVSVWKIPKYNVEKKHEHTKYESNLACVRIV